MLERETTMGDEVKLEQLMTRRETARLLRSCQRKVDSWVQDGSLKAVRLDRRVLFDPRDIQDFIHKRKGTQQ